LGTSQGRSNGCSVVCDKKGRAIFTRGILKYLQLIQKENQGEFERRMLELGIELDIITCLKEETE